MEMIFLGTSSMVPTKERNPTSIMVLCGSEGILVDCAEGTQRQIKKAGQKITKVDKILITHWHGDHVLGLAGLIQSLSASEYNKTLEIYGPKGTKKYFSYLKKAFLFELKIKIILKEVSSGGFFENEDFGLSSLPLKHAAETNGYSIKEKDKLKIEMRKLEKIGLKTGPLIGELQKGKDVVFENKKILSKNVTKIKKGKKAAFVFDTIKCKNAVSLGKDADALVCESTYDSSFEKKAKEYKHMTAKDAAEVAKKAKAKKLFLTHISARYKDTKILEKEAKKIFKNVMCAEDFLKIEV